LSVQPNQDQDPGLILAAEEFPRESFAQFHSFSIHDEAIIRKLSAHGPVLLRGGRGSGKSALLLEAYRRMREGEGALPIYVSLRYLPLLRTDGQEYIGHFCTLLSQEIRQELSERAIQCDFGAPPDQADLQISLIKLAQTVGKRLVLLFDDAAHIGREKPLEAFFDLFRTLSGSLVSCKASIYPGVTKFGVRFDVYNDSTVVDVSRSDVQAAPDFFPDVVKARYPKLIDRNTFSDRLSPTQFANFLGRAVVGNLRGFILACNRFNEEEKIGVPELTKHLLVMATDYYWPLMEEVAPKLGVYESMIEPAKMVFERVVEHTSRPSLRRSTPDRVLVHRNLVNQYSKVFEILEYLGFVARREASRAMKSGGRGPVFAVNLCNLLDSITTRRLTFEMTTEWTAGSTEPSEMHVNGNALHGISLPSLSDDQGLKILSRPISLLLKSRAYPYGLTQKILDRLMNAGIATIGQMAEKSDAELDNIGYIGDERIRRIRDVVYQAIWM
jgi:hypothetical protein